MKRLTKTAIYVVFSFFIIGAIWSFKSNSTFETKSAVKTEKNILNDSLFNTYWYADKAEIKTYNLIQSRYGELHQGKATLIFVAQPFLKKKGVKPNSIRHTADYIQVLKMNLLKKFGTGIYPYFMMLSTFTPLNEPKGLTKASVSGQEWCGHIFSQINKRNNHYDVVSYSYFEEEGDNQFRLPTVLTEDEIWSRIRLNYKTLPIGELDIIPSLYYTRLEQHKFEVEKAQATLDLSTKASIYTLTYPKRKRTLAITFNTLFPHEIVKWEETYADKRAPDKRLTTTATLDKSKNLDYWNYNAGKHKHLREELGVSY